MNRYLPALWVWLAGLVLSLLLLVWWRDSAEGPVLKRREPLDGETATLSAVANHEAIRIGEAFCRSSGVPSAIQGEWPCFRGRARDNVATGGVPLASSWPPEGPPCLWSVELGEGYAGPAVAEGRVYLLDYDSATASDALRCLSLDDGREIWRRSYRVHVKRNHGMSRTVPAVANHIVVSIGPRCQVMAVDSRSGDLKWGLDLVKEWDAEVPLWYTGQCPLIDGNHVILGVGGKVLLAGVDLETGRVVWTTPNPDHWKMSHSCVTPLASEGHRMYLYAAVGGVVGVSAEPADEGRPLWRSDAWNVQVVAPSPVGVGEGRFWMTSGYGAGSALFQVEQRDGAYALKTVKRLDKKTFACEQHTPVFKDGYVYAVLPADAGALRKQAVCMAADGTVRWTSGADHFGLGPFMIADGKLLILEDDGLLTLVEAAPMAYRRLARAKVLRGKEAWAPMALVEGRLLVRDYGMMRCLDLR